MKKLDIIVLENALFDLEEIWLYTFNNWSLEQADKYHSLIFEEFEFLSRKPNSGKSLLDIRNSFWFSKVKSHYIFYRFSKTEIEIVRILHESMDIPNRLEA